MAREKVRVRRTGENLSPDVWESHACPVLDREAAIQVVFASGDLPAIAQRLLPFVDGCAVPSLARIVVRESHTHTHQESARERERDRERPWHALQQCMDAFGPWKLSRMLPFRYVLW